MPEGTTWLTYLLQYLRATLAHNAHLVGKGFILGGLPTWKSWEPIITAGIVALLVILLSVRVRAKLSNTEEAVVPDDKLTLRTFMETFLGYFYDLSKGVMDADRAKKYFPIIGGSACFVFFANAFGADSGDSGGYVQPQHHGRLRAGGVRAVQSVRPQGTAAGTTSSIWPARPGTSPGSSSRSR